MFRIFWINAQYDYPMQRSEYSFIDIRCSHFKHSPFCTLDQIKRYLIANISHKIVMWT